jgi:hypothetical protein
MSQECGDFLLKDYKSTARHKCEDDTIFYYYSLYSSIEANVASDRWKNQLGGIKFYRFRRLAERNPTIYEALKKLIEVPGCLNAISIGNFHKISACHCEEVSSQTPPSRIRTTSLTDTIGNCQVY